MKLGIWFHGFALISICMLGCAGPKAERMNVDEVRDAVRIHAPGDEDSLSWNDFILRARHADVVVLGEMHDDHVGHLVQRAVVQDLVNQSSNVVVAMEMLERDEQPFVDDYSEGLIDKSAFARQTESSNWAGEGSWDLWYLPIIDAAHAGGARVIAANAPRRYVRIARTNGWDRLAELPAERLKYVQWPDPPIVGEYRERFIELMGEHGSDGDLAESMFRAQTTWDATMAGSVARYHPEGGTTVLLVGQFHSNLEGGTVQMLRRYMPKASLLVVCLRPNQADPPNVPSPADLIVETGNDAR
jgi:uncharacterized iron-regulated protein